MEKVNLSVSVKLSQDLLWDVKLEKNTKSLQNQLKDLPKSTLAADLSSQEEAMAFWLNVYNAFIQIALQTKAEQYANKSKFFTSRWIPIAGQHLSFDDIEHGILRRSQFKYGFGYVPKPWLGAFEKKFRLTRKDPRIHFALNCGAKSCPPIRFYSPPEIDSQLNQATQNYLEQECRYDALENKLYLSRLFLWFRGDFGSRKSLRQFLQKYGAMPPGVKPKIKYLDYDWELFLGNYSR